MSEAHCKGCENACPLDNLSCDKGRKLNGVIVETYVPKESLVRQLIRMGKFAEDLSQQMDEYGLEEAILLDNIPNERKIEIAKALDELEDKWKHIF